MAIFISVDSPIFAQPDATPIRRTSDTLYTQNVQETESDPYLEKVKLILEDANQIRQRLKTDPKISKSLETLTKEGNIEDERWVIRRARVKAAFVNVARKLIDKDLAFIVEIADAEDANQIADDVRDLQRQWKSRFSRISREIREALRAENSTTTQSSDRMTRTRGRRGTQEEDRGRRSAIPERDNDTVEPEEIDPAEVAENALVESWASASDDNADSLYSDLESRVVEALARIREKAELSSKTRTVNAIDGVLLMRKERTEKTIAAYQQKLQQRQNEVNNTDTEDVRRGRGRRGQTDGATDTGRRRR